MLNGRPGIKKAPARANRAKIKGRGPKDPRDALKIMPFYSAKRNPSLQIS